MYDQRNNFEIFLNEAQQLSGIDTFSGDKARKKIRKTFFDENLEGEIFYSSKDKMKNETFIPIMDALITQLKKRNMAYTELYNKFGFFSEVEKMKSFDLRKQALELVKMYPEDLETELVEEIIQFKKHISNLPEGMKNMQGMLKYLNTPSLNMTFPNVEIALKIFVCMPCSNASGERSFSVLKRVKNYLRSSLANEKTSALSILSIEDEIVRSIDWTDIVEKFAKLKARKKSFL